MVTVAVYKEAKGRFELGAEWHLNRPKLISTHACSAPNCDHPRWVIGQIIDTCFRLLRDGNLQSENVVQPAVPSSDITEAYIDVDENPEDSVKLAVKF